jgi:GGDEF domain-containing protein
MGRPLPAPCEDLTSQVRHRLSAVHRSPANEKHLIAGAKRERTQMAVLAIGLDGFKAVNDRYGHAAGDTVLLISSERMKQLLAARIGCDRSSRRRRVCHRAGAGRQRRRFSHIK